MDGKALMNRKTAIGAALVGASPLLFPGRVRAAAPADSFVILLKGLYAPVVHGPNLGLSTVDLSDGSYSKTKIYPVSGTPGNTDLNKAIGDFYVQFTGDLCAYHIPGGSFSMRFTGSDYVFNDDGHGGVFLDGTFDLTILEATGTYRPFVGGHISWWTICTSWHRAPPTNIASATSAAHRTTRDQITRRTLRRAVRR